MARLIDIKCPKCSAPLPIAADAQSVTCRYCGGTSVVERPGQHMKAPAGGHVVHVPAAAPGLAARLVWTTALTVGVGVGGMIMARTLTGTRSSSDYSASVPGLGSIPGIDAIPGASALVGEPSFDFSDRPMIADVDGDGPLDIVGKSRQNDIGDYIAAYSGKDGKQLWATAPLTKDASSGRTLRGVALGRVISVDSLGKVQAYDLKSGTPSWSALLGETAETICEGDGVIVIETSDEARHGLEPASGKKREVAKGAACKPVFSSERDVAPGYRIIGWPEFEKNGLPRLNSIDGISAHRALVPTDPGPRFMLGSRDKGTSVAMVAALDPKKKVLWKDVVPGVDPLTTSVNVTTQDAAFIDGKLIVPYEMNDRDQGMRMACFDGTTGERLWDVQALPDGTPTSGLAVAPDRIYLASWSALIALSLKTGQIEFRVGRK